jgi:hypothetical protein
MKDKEAAFFQRRAEQERSRVENCDNPKVVDVHRQLLERYELKLEEYRSAIPEFS